ncbi:transposase [Collimonas sp.]|jgi:transposase|uniref:transposase n=1 Tax=Collimonas sp. TaxID=1963772 RepID=UPI002C08449C|nr:transposase [Collimonas sp.]HWX01780.1 transposase [Collimonas sp.]
MILQDDQWRRLEQLLSAKSGYSDTRAKNNRQFIEALLWLIGSERTWHELPARFGKWNTVYVHFRRWNAANLWGELLEDLHADDELREVIEKICAYGKQRKLRSKYRSAMSAAVAADGDSGQHWLRLVDGSLP